MYSLIVKNGTIIDGTGSPRYQKDIAIRGEEIVKIQKNLNDPGNVRTLDATGLVVTPGFIDMHSHSDFSLIIDRDVKSALYQGVTTEVIGNCGMSCYPVGPEKGKLLESYVVGIGYDRSLPLNWVDFEGYAKELEQSGLGINVISLVGHGTIRIAVMGFDARQATRQEQEAMRHLLRNALDQGAFGMSSGLVYPPGINSPTEELENLCKIVAHEDGIYSTHLRGDSLRAGPTLVESLGEAIDVAKNTGVYLEVSHIAPKFPNTGTSHRVLEMMEEARRKGINVTCDVHPYLAAMTFLVSLMPPWVFEGGTKETIRRLSSKEERSRISRELRLQFGHLDWEDFWARNEPVLEDQNSNFKGKRFTEIAKMVGKDPAEACLDILLNEGEDLFKVAVLQWIYSEEDTLKTFLWPYTMIGADGASSSTECKIESLTNHPRSWGTFPKVIRQFCKENNQIQLEQAIHKMTGLPASSLRLRDRGIITEGFKADLVVFDFDRIRAKATYTNPRQYSDGIEYVLVNGGVVIEKGHPTGMRLGKVLRKK
ncbi:MAG: D-aminoacylase [Deltaproteobacteria bacterium]|nr:D-aminoacylase [Deltaproteobacteria bacterium]